MAQPLLPAAAASPRTLSLIVYKATADGVSKMASLAITVAAARSLSSQDFGVLALAMTTGWLISVASDAGLPLYLAKRLARSVAAGERATFAPVADVLRLRGALGIIGSAVGLAVGVILTPGLTALAFWIIVIAQITNAVLETLAHAYRGLGRSDIESTIVVVQRLCTATIAIGVLWWTSALLPLACALIVPPTIALVVSTATAERMLAREAGRPLTAPAGASSPYSHLPVGLGIFLSALYFRCDVFFIERWHGLEAVGTYNAAFRIVEALRLLPAAVLAVSFPMLCTANDSRLLRSLLAPLVGSAVVIAAAIYVFAPITLDVLYGARFIAAAPALALLSLALPLFFANYAFTHQVIAWDGQKAYLAIVIAALAANLGGNALLIPGRGMEGAALSTIATEVVVSAGCLIALARRGGHAGLRATPAAEPRGLA